jgi:hypothetical protein
MLLKKKRTEVAFPSHRRSFPPGRVFFAGSHCGARSFL